MGLSPLPLGIITHWVSAVTGIITLVLNMQKFPLLGGPWLFTGVLHPLPHYPTHSVLLLSLWLRVGTLMDIIGKTFKAQYIFFAVAQFLSHFILSIYIRSLLLIFFILLYILPYWSLSTATTTTCYIQCPSYTISIIKLSTTEFVEF